MLKVPTLRLRDCSALPSSSARQATDVRALHLAPRRTSNKDFRISVVQVDAFIKHEETTEIALDAYKVLGLGRMASTTSVMQAYDKLIMGHPSVQISQVLLCSRAVILKAAADTLLNPLERQAFDKTEMLQIPPTDLAGAVALLLESGEWESAAEWGQAWLASNQGHSCAQDVALCIATSHYRNAVYKIQQSIEHAINCEPGLKAGLNLLQQYQIAEELQTELQDTLEVLAPQIALQLLSRSSRDKQRALSMLPGLLWRGGQPTQGFQVLKMGRMQYLKAVRSCLTASEQIRLIHKPVTQGVSDEERYDDAMALLAAGFSSFQPALIRDALGTLGEIDNKLEAATGRKRFDAIDVSVETAVCHILLGEIDAAEAALGLTDGSPRTADPGIKQFVAREAGDDSTDFLPGLYKFAQQWISDVASANFAELAESGVDLDAWFQHRRVRSHLKIGEGGSALQLLQAPQNILHGLILAVSKLMAAVASLCQALLSPFSSPAQRVEDRSPPVRPPQEAAHQPQNGLSAEPTIAQAVLAAQEARENPDEYSSASNIGQERQTKDMIPDFGYTTEEDKAPLQASSSALQEEGPVAPTSADPLAERVRPQFRKNSPPLAQEVGLSLEAVSNQTLGQIQEQLREVMPVEETDGGFGTAYTDMPVASFRQRSQIRSRLPTPPDAPNLLLLEGEERMWAPEDGNRRLQLALLIATAVCLVVYTYYGKWQLEQVPIAGWMRLASHKLTSRLRR